MINSISQTYNFCLVAQNVANKNANYTVQVMNGLIFQCNSSTITTLDMLVCTLRSDMNQSCNVSVNFGSSNNNQSVYLPTNGSFTFLSNYYTEPGLYKITAYVIQYNYTYTAYVSVTRGKQF